MKTAKNKDAKRVKAIKNKNKKRNKERNDVKKTYIDTAYQNK